MANAGIRLSLCMIVRNERRDLPACLRSVRGLADESIVVDTGSTDGTQSIATDFGAQLIQTEWTGDFSRARNIGLERARGAWILVLDADEELLPADRKAVSGLLDRRLSGDGPAKVAYNLLQKSSSDGGRSGMLVPIVRLFPNHPQVRYEWPVHEQVVTSLQRLGFGIENTGIEILHHGYADAARNRDKQRRNIGILKRQIDEGTNVSTLTWFLLGGAHLDLGELEPAVAAYRECVRTAGGDLDIVKGARVRIATCLTDTGRFEEALGAIRNASKDGIVHPELSLAAGRCERSLGRPVESRAAYESVLRWSDEAFLPPCNLENVKTEAALGIAELVRAGGDAAGGVSILRAVSACRRAGRRLTPAILADADGGAAA